MTGVIHITVFALAGAAVAFLAAEDPPLAMLFGLMPVALVAGAYAVVAAVNPVRSVNARRLGRSTLVLLFLLIVETFLFSATDWVHGLWSVQYPLYGLLFASGFMLVRVWAADCQGGWNGATIAGFALALLVALSAALPRTASRAQTPSPTLPALVETARYGFGGDVPALMQPIAPRDRARGLGVPTRNVTVTMGASLSVAFVWILFVALALVGRVIRSASRRKAFLLLAPLLVAPAAFLFGTGRSACLGIWRNEPWLVRSYGPLLLCAALATIVLIVLVRRDRRRFA